MAGEPQVNPPSTSSTQSITVEYVPGRLRMHTISEDKLDMLVSGNAPVHLTFFGVCFGAAISFGVVLYNGGIDQHHQSVYTMLLWASGILALYFGVRGGTDYFQSSKKIDEIKNPKQNST